MHGRLLILSVALVSGGCASANPPDSAGDTALDGTDGPSAVEMIVVNRTSRAVTAFAAWRNGARIRLGEVRGRATVAFVTPYRDAEVWLSLDVVSSTPPAGTTRDAPFFSGGSPRGGRTNRPQGGFVSVYPGDRYEWEVRRVVPVVDLYYRRLIPE